MEFISYFAIYLGTYLVVFLILFMPHIICLLLTVMIIGLIKTKLISRTFKILIIIIILLFVCIILINIKSEKPSDLYRQMKQISDNQSLIGLSKEQVVTLLGEPIYEKYSREEENKYSYHAGSIGKGLFFCNKAIFFDCYYGYILNIYFDERDIVEHTSIQCVP